MATPAKKTKTPAKPEVVEQAANTIAAEEVAISVQEEIATEEVVDTDVKASDTTADAVEVKESVNIPVYSASVPIPAYTTIKELGSALNGGKILSFNTNVTVLSKFGNTSLNQNWQKASLNADFVDTSVGAPCAAWVGGKRENAVIVDFTPKSINGNADQVYVEFPGSNEPTAVHIKSVEPSRATLKPGSYLGEVVFLVKTQVAADALEIPVEQLTQDDIDNLAYEIFQEGSELLLSNEYRLTFRPLAPLGSIPINGHKMNNNAASMDLLFVHAGATVRWGFDKAGAKPFNVVGIDPAGPNLITEDNTGKRTARPLIGSYHLTTVLFNIYDRMHDGKMENVSNTVKFLPANEVTLLEAYIIKKFEVAKTLFTTGVKGDSRMVEGYSLKVMKEVEKEILRTDLPSLLGLKLTKNKVDFDQVALKVIAFIKALA